MKFGKLTTNAEKDYARESFQKCKKDTADIINGITVTETENGIGKEKTKIAVECLFSVAATRDQYFDGIELLKELGLKSKDIIKLQKNWEAASKFGQVPIDMTDAVDLYFDHHEINVTLKNFVTTNNALDDLKTLDKDANSYDKIFHEMQKSKKTLDSIYRSFTTDLFQYSNVRASNAVAIAAWQQKLDKVQSENLLHLFQSISSEGKLDKNVVIQGKGALELEKFINAVVDTEQTDYDVAYFTIASFIWQVKRKLSGQRVSDHLMPVLVGPQGGGKTRAITNLLTPVNESTTTANFKQVGDDRYARIFDSLVLFADEMSFMDKANADNLKNLITSDEISNRPLHSNNIQMIKMNSTFIGASNKGLAQIFFDDSGMRRFIEIMCLSKEFMRKNWETINEIDYDAIWRSVNEFSAVNPITAVSEKIALLQEDMRAISPIEDWLRSYIVKDEMDYIKKYSFKQLFSIFDLYRMDFHPNYKTNATSFRNNMTSLLRNPEYSKITVEGKRGADGNMFYFVHDETRKLAASYTDDEYDPIRFDPIYYNPAHPQYEYYIDVVERERETTLDAKLPVTDVVVDMIPTPDEDDGMTTADRIHAILERRRKLGDAT